MLNVFAVSDATGETVQRMAQSALVQFADAEVRVVRRGQVITQADVKAVVKEAAASDAILLYTLVSAELRRLILAECRLRSVDCVDVLGPLLDRLAVHLRLTPQQKPGLYKQLADERTRQIEAVDFAFRHDDGQNIEELVRAELVLVGVSRTMKTPAMLYLAYHGWFVANVPLVPELPVPKALAAYPAERVFCLNMRPDRLLERRLVRAEEEAIPVEPYASEERVRQEYQYAERLCARYGWQRIDVTGKAVEEVSREITAMLQEDEKTL